MVTSLSKRGKKGLAIDLRIVANGLDKNTVATPGWDYKNNTNPNYKGTPEQFAAKFLRLYARRLEHVWTV